MKFISLELLNFTSLRGQNHIRFASSGVMAITGPTGAGKSSILDAITLALFGRIARYGGQNSLASAPYMSSGCAETKVTLEFEISGVGYLAVFHIWRARKSPDGKLQPAIRSLAYAHSSEVIASGIKDTDRAIKRLSGLDFEGFCHTVILPQGRFAMFLSSSERSGLLGLLLDLKIYREIGICAHENARSVREQIALLEGKIAECASEAKLLGAQRQFVRAKISARREQAKERAASWRLKTAQAAEEFKQKLNICLTSAKEAINCCENQNFERLNEHEKYLASQAAISELKEKLATICDAGICICNNYKRSKFKSERLERNIAAITRALEAPIPKSSCSFSISELFARFDGELTNIKQKINLYEQKIHKEEKLAFIELANAAIAAANARISHIERGKINQIFSTTAQRLKEQFVLASRLKLLENIPNANELKALYDGLLKQLECKREQHIKALASELADCEEELNRSLASRLAKLLKNGEPCMVCGSLEHPKTSCHQADEAALSARASSLRQQLAAASAQPVTATSAAQELSERLFSAQKSEGAVLQAGGILLQSASALESAKLELEGICASSQPVAGQAAGRQFAGGPNAAAISAFYELHERISSLAKRLVNDLAANFSKTANFPKNTPGCTAAAAAVAVATPADPADHADPAAVASEICVAIKQQNWPKIAEILHQLASSQTLSLQRSAAAFACQQLTQLCSLLDAGASALFTHAAGSAQDADLAALCAAQKAACIAQNRPTLTLAAAATTAEQSAESLLAQITALREQLAPFAADFGDCLRELAALQSDVQNSQNAAAAAVLAQLAGCKNCADLAAALHSRLAALQARSQQITAARKKASAQIMQALWQLQTPTQPLFERICLHAKPLDDAAVKQLQTARAAALKLCEEALMQLARLQFARFASSQISAAKCLKIAKSANVYARHQALGRAELELERTQKSRQIAQQLGRQIEQIRSQHKSVLELAELIGDSTGKKFSKAAQQIAMRLLIALANSYLAQIFARYELALGDDEAILVRDVLAGGHLRASSSLSGGETFVVSLSLALALSALAQRRFSVEARFIDEGFGSLDEASLEVALSALIELSELGGSRLIGLISHVPGLADRVANSIEIIPTAAGYSRIR